MLHAHPQVHVQLASLSLRYPILSPSPTHINSSLVNMQLSASHRLPSPSWKPSHKAIFFLTQRRPHVLCGLECVCCGLNVFYLRSGGFVLRLQGYVIQVLQPTQALHKSPQGRGPGHAGQDLSTPPLATTMCFDHTLLFSRLQLGYRMRMPAWPPHSYHRASACSSRAPTALRALVLAIHSWAGLSSELLASTPPRPRKQGFPMPHQSSQECRY